jgi:hypothetical protein
LELACDGEEDDVLWVYAEVVAQVDRAVHGDVLVRAV